MKFVRQSVQSALLCVLFLLSGCVAYEGVFVEASRPGVTISPSEVSVVKEVSNQVANELNVLRASDRELAAYATLVHRRGHSAEIVAKYDFPDRDHRLAIVVFKFAPSANEPGKLVIAPGVAGWFGGRMLHRMEQLLNQRLGPGRAKIKGGSVLGW